MGSFTAQCILIAIAIAAAAVTVSAEKVPYLVSLIEKNGNTFCNGAILDDKTIIATAYCVIDTKGYLFKHREGFTVKAGDKTKEVEKVIHLQDPSKIGYDLSGANIIIIKLKEGLDIDNDPNLARVNLPNVLSRDNYEGKILTLATADITEKTYKMRMSTNSTRKYRQNGPENSYFHTEFVDSQVSNCTKIMLGPLVYDNTLIGLHHSYGVRDNGKTCYRHGFINISSHLGFIINAIQENYICNMRVLKI